MSQENTMLRDELYYLDELDGLKDYIADGCPLEKGLTANDILRRIYSRVLADLFTKMEREINEKPSSFFGPTRGTKDLAICCGEAIRLRNDLFALFDEFREYMDAPVVDFRDKEVCFDLSPETMKNEGL